MDKCAPKRDVDVEYKQMLQMVHEYIPQAQEKGKGNVVLETKNNAYPKVIYSPYNPANTEITLNDVQSILTTYGVPPMVRNLGLYRRAFVHRSYVKRPLVHNDIHNVYLHRPDDCSPLRTKSNERLEFVGDGVLECITKMYLYKRFPKEDEGFMTEKKIALVKNEHIGKLALDMNLNRWFVMSRHAEDKNTRHNVKKLGCLFEAFLGAVFLDFNGIAIHDQDRLFDDVFLTGPGFQVAQVFLEKIFDRHVDWSTIIHLHDNYKNILQVHIQQIFKVTPHYIIHDSTSHFEMGVYLILGEPESLSPKDATPFVEYGTCNCILECHKQNGSVFVFLGKGTHPVKKKAEQIACKMAIELFKPGTPLDIE